VEPTDENLRAWERAHRPRDRGRERPEIALPEEVRQSVTDLHGKRVLHLNCGTGIASAQLAELGASVTAVDPDESALELGRERAPAVLWIPAEPHALPAELQRGRFDLVYGGPETVQTLRDLDLFAGNVAAALRAGGDLLLFDDHPSSLCVDGLMHWREDYFAAGFHRLGQLVGAIARHHLTMRALEEYPAAAGSFHDTRIPGSFLLHARKNR
jgi:SAM-dependent methyltransferase